MTINLNMLYNHYFPPIFFLRYNRNIMHFTALDKRDAHIDIFFSFYKNTSCLSTKTPLFKYIENFTTKKGKFSVKKKSDIFHISAENIDCGYSLESPRRGGSNEFPQSMFLSRNKKNNVYPCKPQLYYIKVGFKGVKII